MFQPRWSLGKVVRGQHARSRDDVRLEGLAGRPGDVVGQVALAQEAPQIIRGVPENMLLDVEVGFAEDFRPLDALVVVAIEVDEPGPCSVELASERSDDPDGLLGGRLEAELEADRGVFRQRGRVDRQGLLQLDRPEDHPEPASDGLGMAPQRGILLVAGEHGAVGDEEECRVSFEGSISARRTSQPNRAGASNWRRIAVFHRAIMAVVHLVDDDRVGGSRWGGSGSTRDFDVRIGRSALGPGSGRGAVAARREYGASRRVAPAGHQALGRGSREGLPGRSWTVGPAARLDPTWRGRPTGRLPRYRTPLGPVASSGGVGTSCGRPRGPGMLPGGDAGASQPRRWGGRRARSGGGGGRPRRAGWRRAACRRRASGLCDIRRGRWRGGRGSASRRTGGRRSGRRPGPAAGGSGGRGPSGSRRASGRPPSGPLGRVDPPRAPRNRASSHSRCWRNWRRAWSTRISSTTWRSGRRTISQAATRQDGRTTPQMSHPMAAPPAILCRVPPWRSLIIRSVATGSARPPSRRRPAGLARRPAGRRCRRSSGPTCRWPAATTAPSARPHAVGFATVQLFTKSNNQWRAAAADRRPRRRPSARPWPRRASPTRWRTTPTSSTWAAPTTPSGRSRSTPWSSRSSAARPWGSATW